MRFGVSIGWLCFRMKCEEFVWGFEVCGVLGFFYGVASTVPDAVTKLVATFANPFSTLI